MKNIFKIFGLFKNKKFRRNFIIVAVIILLIAGGIYYLKVQKRVFIDDSLIQAPIINITTASPGTLNEIDVDTNQMVRKGDQLAVVGTQSLRAGTDGIIVQANKQVGSLVSSQSNVAQMINPNDFRVVGTLDENKGLKDIRVGQVASFTVDAFSGQTFWGYVDQVAETARQTQIAFSISSERPVQQFDISVRFDPYKYPQIKNGMSAKLTVYTATH